MPEEQQKMWTYFFQIFEQEKFSLQREIELKNRMLESLSFECEALKQQQNMQLEKQREQLERVHAQEIGDLKNKVWNLNDVCVKECFFSRRRDRELHT